MNDDTTRKVAEALEAIGTWIEEQDRSSGRNAYAYNSPTRVIRTAVEALQRSLR